MGSCVRLFILDHRGQLLRLQSALFTRMLQHPSAYPLPIFAGQQVRCAEVVLQLVGRRPAGLTRESFWTMPFDRSGKLDTLALGRQCVARVDAFLEKAWAGQAASATVVNASSRFIANAGLWKPTRAE